MTDLDAMRAKITNLCTQADIHEARVVYHLSELRGGLAILLELINTPDTSPNVIAQARKTLADFESILADMQRIVPEPPELPPHADLN